MFQTCACDECMSTSLSEECPDVCLWQVAQARFRLKTVLRLCLGPLHKKVPVGPVHALHQDCEISSSYTRENLNTALSENQLDNTLKAAGARQHLLNDTDVHLCSGYIVLLSYAVNVEKCFDKWSFLGRMKRESVPRMSQEA